MNHSVGPTGDVSRAELFDSLCNVRRLHVLDYLSERGPEAELGTLVDHVAAAEYEKARSAVSRPERRRVYVSLYQTHLPKLEEQGLIEWDRDENRIRLVARRSVDAILDSGEPEPTPWYRYYLGLSVASGALFALVLGGVEPFAAVAPRHYAVAFALAFLALSVTQWVSSRRRTIRPGDRLIPK
jgi:VIT1/CCC1 family predicted Fe2+/Mn2+ transporter